MRSRAFTILWRGRTKTGEYIFLFGTEEYDTEGLTVADLKAAADTFPAKMQIRFTDGAHTPEPEPTETPEETRDGGTDRDPGRDRDRRADGDPGRDRDRGTDGDPGGDRDRGAGAHARIYR